MELMLACLLALAADRTNGMKYEYLRAESSFQADTMADRTLGQVIICSVNNLCLTPELICRLFGPPNITSSYRDSFDVWYVRYGVVIYFRLRPDYDSRRPKVQRVDGSICPN